VTATLLDCTLRFNRSLRDYRYSATFRLAEGFTVRVRLCHDDCGNASFAVAEILDDLAWTRLVRTNPVLPLGDASNVAGRLESFARDLLDEARVVLIRDGGAG
jgi:hypothetical protein